MALFDRLNRIASSVGELINDDVRARLDLAEALIGRGDPDAALHELQQALERRRDSARAHHLLGLCYLRRGRGSDLDDALAALQQALALNPEAAETHSLLGELRERRGEDDEAVDSYRAALGLAAAGEQRAALWRRVGRLYLRRGRLDKAVRELRKAAAEAPDDAEAQGLLGQALVQSAQRRGELGSGPQFEAARLALSRAARAERPEPRALAALGKVLLSAGRTEDAERALHRALEVAPEEPTAVLGLGQLRLASGELEDPSDPLRGALALARRAAALCGVPDSEDGAQDDAALAPTGPLENKKDRERAQAAATARANERGESLESWQGVQEDALLLLARCLAGVGDAAAALRQYRRALALREGTDAEPAIAREALRLALRRGRYTDAASLAGLAVLAETPEGLAARAQEPGLFQRDPAAAQALLERAIGGGEHHEARLCEGRFLLLRDPPDVRGATDALRRAALLDPDDPRSREELTALYQRERGTVPHDLYGQLMAAQRHFSRSPELAASSIEAAALLATLDRPLLITVMGEFNSGKSTFVNALLGEDVAPMGITPTTATINILKYGRTRGGRVVYRDDSSRDVPWDEVPALLRAVDEDEARRIRVVEVLYPLEILQQVNVVDTPGLNSILPEHEATAREFIAQADAVVWLFTVDQAGKASEREALATIHAEGRRVLGVLNKIDRLGPGALAPPEPPPPPASEESSGSVGAAIDAPADEAPPPEAPGAAALREILAHLNDPDSGLCDLLEAIVPFSGRDALLGQKAGDLDRQRRANLPLLWQTLEDRFFAHQKTLKETTVRARLQVLLRRARATAERLRPLDQGERLGQALRLSQADAVLFQRDFLPAERRRLIAAADEVHRLAARETLDFVRPRRWPFGENQAAPADRDFLISLLEERLATLVQAGRARVVAELRLSDDEPPRLLDEQVYGRYRAFARGYLRGGKVEDFFLRVLPRLDLSEAAIQRALERDAPTALDMLEEELLTPLARFAERHFQRLQQRLRQELLQAELARCDIEERIIAPLDALLTAP